MILSTSLGLYNERRPAGIGVCLFDKARAVLASASQVVVLRSCSSLTLLFDDDSLLSRPKSPRPDFLIPIRSRHWSSMVPSGLSDRVIRDLLALACPQCWEGGLLNLNIRCRCKYVLAVAAYPQARCRLITKIWRFLLSPSGSLTI